MRFLRDFARLPGHDLFRSLSEARDRRDRGRVRARVHRREARGRQLHGVRAVGPDAVRGATYVLTPERVHELDVPVAQAVRAFSQWGIGTGSLVGHMKPRKAD
jgi:hypothetical protein